MNKLGLNYTQNRVGSMACLFFTEKPVENHDDAVASDVNKYAKYFQSMLEQGVYLAPSQFEAMFTSTAHSDADLEKTIKANYSALQAVEQ